MYNEFRLVSDLNIYIKLRVERFLDYWFKDLRSSIGKLSWLYEGRFIWDGLFDSLLRLFYYINEFLYYMSSSHCMPRFLVFYVFSIKPRMRN